MAEYTRRVLVIGDDPLVTSYICDLLGEFGYDCRSASSRPDAMWLAKENNPDVVIVDMSLPNMTDGITLGQALLERFDTSVIFLSEFDDDLIGQVQLVRSVSLLRKPCRPSEILGAIEAAALCSRTNQEGVPCL
jgi:two-component system, OmpR family, response regulator VicR